MRIIRGPEITKILAGREREVIDSVRQAYLLHDEEKTVLPHSSFLRWPGRAAGRIIALPAYLGGPEPVAGLKWISSFPSNHNLGLPRASAVIVLNSTETGVPEAILEGSAISAARTAASAALAADALKATPERIGLIGCGLIGRETLSFLRHYHPHSNWDVRLFDLEKRRAAALADYCQNAYAPVTAKVASSSTEVLATCSLVILATTAATPYIDDLSSVRTGATLLHISLRDLAPEVILGCRNIVDDVEHVSREKTSIHLAQMLKGDVGYIDGTLADVLRGRVPPRRSPNDVVVFSPFGLGILDLAVAQMVAGVAQSEGLGVVIESFLP